MKIDFLDLKKLLFKATFFSLHKSAACFMQHFYITLYFLVQLLPQATAKTIFLHLVSFLHGLTPKRLQQKMYVRRQIWLKHLKTSHSSVVATRSNKAFVGFNQKVLLKKMAVRPGF